MLMLFSVFGGIWFILKPSVNLPGSIFNFFPDHFWGMKKSFVWNEVCFASSNCRSGLKNGLLGDWHSGQRQCGCAGQRVRPPPLSLYCDFSKQRRGRGLGEPACAGKRTVLAALLGLKPCAEPTCPGVLAMGSACRVLPDLQQFK